MRGLNYVSEGGASPSTHSQACLPPAGFCLCPVPEIPLDSFSQQVHFPSQSDPAHLLGFDLQDLNNHKNRDFFGFFKGFSPAKHAKLKPTAKSCQGRCFLLGRGGKEEQEALTHQFVTSSLILSWHSLTSDKFTPCSAYLRAVLAAGMSGFESWITAVQPGIPRVGTTGSCSSCCL